MINTMVYLEIRAEALQFLLSFFLVSSYLFVCLRIYIRCRLTKTFSADDLFLLASLASFSIYTGTSLLSVQYGIGSRPEVFDDPDSLSTALQYWFFSELLHILTITVLRISIYLQLLPFMKTSIQDWACLTFVSLSTLYNAGFFFISIFQCTPIEYFWTGWLGDNGNCMSSHSLAGIAYGFSVLGAVIDWGLALLSLWLLKNEEMTRRMKSAFGVVVGMGLFAGAAALVRIPATKALLKTDDFFWDCIPMAISSLLETGLGIMALAAASFGHLCPSFFVESAIRLPMSLPTVRPDLKSFNSGFYGDLVSITGRQTPVRASVFRKVSDERVLWNV